VAQLQLGATAIDYRIERSARRRSICITVHPRDGVVVKAPPWVPEAEIAAFVRLKTQWVLKHQAFFAAQGQSAAQPAPAPRLEDGTELSYLGQRLTLRLKLTPAPPGARPACRALRGGDELWLRGHVPPDLHQSALRASLERWYRREAKLYLPGRIRHFCAQLGLAEPGLLVRSQRTRWGSCSSSGVLRINWRIMFAPIDVVDYLVAHEVCHLREMNHSSRFWALVGRLVPDYKALRHTLRYEGHRYSLE
jgi:predicted metal-dependent hydrolase